MVGTEAGNAARHEVLALRLNRRRLLHRAAALGLGVPVGAGLLGLARPTAGMAQEADCPPGARASPAPGASPVAATGKRIRVTVAYLSVPFYANFKTGLEDGAAQFGLEYDLRDGKGDAATEVANIQDFIAQQVDLILLTPMNQGTIPAIKQANEAGIPVIEVNNRAGYESGEAEVVTYVGADDVEFGRLQGQLFHDTFAGQPTKVAYVQGISGTSPQINRAKGWDDELAKHPEYEEVARLNDDFDSAKALAVTQDVLSRFPQGQLDAIAMQDPEGVAAAEFARQSGRDEVKFILGDYPADVRQAIIDGLVVGTINQDPYPQAYQAMRMASLYLAGQESEIPKPFYQPLPIITAANAEQTPPAWGC
jgi:ribose transport system substrate-binding protein